MPEHAVRRHPLAPARSAAAALFVAAAATGAPGAAAAQAQPTTRPAPQATTGGRDSAAVAVQLDSARAAFTRALNSGNKTTLLAAFADSARITSALSPAPMGAGEFADGWFQQGSTVSSLRAASVRVAGPGDATESGEYTLTSGTVGRYTIVWRRAPSGRWAVRTMDA